MIDNMTVSASGTASASESHRILLLMQTGEDRRLLEAWLEQWYTVIAVSDVEKAPRKFDLCLLDQHTFARYTDELTEWKERAAPTFLPYLLLYEEDAITSTDQRVWEYVDELLSTPIEKTELRGRLAGLLVRRDLSKSLAEREERIRRILRAIPDPLLIVDETGIVVETNSALEAYTGFERDRLEGVNLAAIDAFPSETVATLVELTTSTSDTTSEDTTEPHAATTEAETAESTTITYRSADGTMRYAEVGVAPLLETRTAKQQTLFILRDVTDRFTREEALERERDRLENFADMLAHEVRNPLNIAQGFLEQVIPDSEREEAALDRVSSSHTRMEQMVKELLAHARGDLVNELQTVNLAQIARIAWGQTPTAEASLEIVDEETTIEADPENFQTILENVFRNAMEHAGPTAMVRIGPLQNGGFYIEDDGPGISVGDREHVFEQGFTTNSAGTGLGLALVRQVAEAHGWTIHVTESDEGGARFEFHESATERRL